MTSPAFNSRLGKKAGEVTGGPGQPMEPTATPRKIFKPSQWVIREDASPLPIDIHFLGRKSYRDVWEKQRQIQQSLMDGSGRDTIIVCEHDPVITVGRGASEKNILVDRIKLAEQGVEVFEVERGGDVTFHGPGQVVMYPLVNLNHSKRDVAWFMRGLEEAVLKTLWRYLIQGQRVEGRTGVWVSLPGELPSEGAFPLRKIASQGIRISRWCTMHGVALNVEDCDAGFALINPCGYTDARMTSISQVVNAGSNPISAPLNTDFVGTFLAEDFCSVFGYQANVLY